MKVGVVTFPGSNCDADARFAARFMGNEAVQLWHKDSSLPPDLDVIILPGGFSYGDYLRTGAIARFSPIMKEVVRFANEGGLVFGICNGFQILCEVGLLPGALILNGNQQFACKDVLVKIENKKTPFTNSESRIRNSESPSGLLTVSSRSPSGLLRLPIAHGEGRFTATPEVLAELEANNRVLFRYVNEDGTPTPESNPNGSQNNIAGILNERGNVMGLMPHPERAVDPLLGSADGQIVFESLALHLSKTEEPAL